MEQEPKTPRERVEDLISLLVPNWRPNPQQVLWAIRIVLLSVLVLGILTLVGRPFDITLWQWLDLLIIPAVLAVGGYLFTRSENRASRLVAEQRTQDEALQAYLDQMGQMLLDKDWALRQSDEDDDVQTLARARTLTVLTRLDGERKRSVLQFLYESGVINTHGHVVSLTEADLSGARLHSSVWTYIDLSGTDLSSADLMGTILRGANLRGTDLENADLRFARGITAEELDQQSVSLEGATLPNGQKYEEWIKSRGEGDSGS